MISGKISNKYAAEKEYVEKIKSDKDYLDQKTMSAGSNGEKF